MTERICVLPPLPRNRASRCSNGHGPTRRVYRSDATERKLASLGLVASSRTTAHSLPSSCRAALRPGLTAPLASKQSP